MTWPLVLVLVVAACVLTALLACLRMAAPRTPQEQAAADAEQMEALRRPVDMEDVVRALGGEGW